MSVLAGDYFRDLGGGVYKKVSVTYNSGTVAIQIAFYDDSGTIFDQESLSFRDDEIKSMRISDGFIALKTLSGSFNF